MKDSSRRVLLITDAWHPQVNGVVRTLETMTNVLQERHVRVTIVHPGMFATVPLPSYPEIRLALFPRKKVLHVFDTEQFDAVHISTEGPLGWAARRICRERSLPYTTSYHSHFVLHVRARVRGFDRIVYALLRKFHSGAIRTMVSTKSLADELSAHGFHNLVLWPLGVDTNSFSPIPNVALPYERPIFTYMGRLAPEKSVAEFLALDLPGTKLVIGDGPSRSSLKGKYPRAIYTGYKKGRELSKLLSASDVFVFPSRTETFGLVTLEALACGVPVAAHDVMGPRDIITDGKDGFLDEDLKQAALKALSLDRRACREKALQYSWERSADAFLENLAWRNAL